MPKSTASKILITIFFVFIVFIVFFKKEAHVKGEITIEIHDHELGKGVKVKLTDEDCKKAFELRDRYIKFLENTELFEDFEIQAERNLREVLWIRWKFPERKLYDNLPPGRAENQSREITLLSCMRYIKSMRSKIEEAEKRLRSITRAEIEKMFAINRVIANYADTNIKSQKMKDALGRP